MENVLQVHVVYGNQQLHKKLQNMLGAGGMREREILTTPYPRRDNLFAYVFIQ